MFPQSTRAALQLYVLLLLATIGRSQIAWQDAANAEIKVADNCDFPGDGVYVTGKVRNIKECGKLCLESENNCSHFTWYKYRELCNLKTSTPAKWDPVANPISKCGYVSPKTNIGTLFNWRDAVNGSSKISENCHFHMQDAQTMGQVESIENCAHLCLNSTDDCSHFTWHRSEQSCTLQKSPHADLQAEPHQNYDCGFIPTTNSASQIELTVGTDVAQSESTNYPEIAWKNAANGTLKVGDQCYFDYTIDSVQYGPTTWEDCQTRCSRANMCTNFNHHVSDGRCQLKRSIFEKWDPVHDPDWKCGYAPAKVDIGSVFDWKAAANGSIKFSDNCNFAGHDLVTIANVVGNNIKGCWKRCLRFKNCTHFIWKKRDPRCILKKSPYADWKAQDTKIYNCGFVTAKTSQVDLLDVTDHNAKLINQTEIIWQDAANSMLKVGDQCYFDYSRYSIRVDQITQEECQMRCALSDDCTNFNYHEIERRCQLKTAFFYNSDPVEEPLWKCGYKPAKVAAVGDFGWRDGKDGEVKWSDQCDFYKHDLYGDGHETLHDVTTLEKCWNRCINSQDCTHFTWDFMRPACYLKRSPFIKWQPQKHELSYCGFIASRAVM